MYIYIYIYIYIFFLFGCAGLSWEREGIWHRAASIRTGQAPHKHKQLESYFFWTIELIVQTTIELLELLELKNLSNFFWTYVPLKAKRRIELVVQTTSFQVVHVYVDFCCPIHPCMRLCIY